jgi:hypothetical protein
VDGCIHLSSDEFACSRALAGDRSSRDTEAALADVGSNACISLRVFSGIS